MTERCPACGAAVDRRGALARIMLSPLLRELRSVVSALEKAVEGL